MTSEIETIRRNGFKRWADERPRGSGYYRFWQNDLSCDPVRVVYLYDLEDEQPEAFPPSMAGSFCWGWDPLLDDPEAIETSWMLDLLYWAPLDVKGGRS